MKKYILKRLGISLLVLFGVSIFIFALIHLQPGNPYLNMMSPNTPKEKIQEILIQKGYYDPIYIKYFKWVSAAVKLDFGYSIQYGTLVKDIILDRLPNTLLLSIPSLILSILLSIPIGIYCAYKEGGIADHIVTTLCLLGVSIPTFFFGILLIKIFAFDFKLFPISGMTNVSVENNSIAQYKDLINHMILPMIVLTYIQMSSFIRYIRGAMIEVLKKEYMRVARGKGLSMYSVIRKHGLKNIATSIITVICLEIPNLFSGALVTETVFVWPGIGKLNYDAAAFRDYPLIMGLLIFTVIIVLLSNILADILYVIVDQRIGLE